MTGIQTRDSVGDSSDDEPLSKLMKYKSTPERTQYLEETTLAVDGTGGGPKKQHSSASLVSDSLEDASVKKTPKESSLAAESPGHSSDSEPISTLLISKGSAPSSAHGPPDTAAQDSPDSEDDQPLMTLIKKKPEREATATLDAKSSKKRKMTTRASQASSQSQVKTTQKRGRKGKAEARKKASAPSTAENQTPKRRGRPKKADSQMRAPSSDTSDDEPLSELVGKKNQPEIKHAVVLLKRMSKSDVMDAISQGRVRSGEQTSTAREVGAASPEETSDEEPLSLKVKRLKWQSKPARGGPVADTSSDNEPLLKQVKTIQGKHKCRERTNGEDDAPKHESKLAGELKDDSDGKCLGERKTDEIPPSPHRESSSS